MKAHLKGEEADADGAYEAALAALRRQLEEAEKAKLEGEMALKAAADEAEAVLEERQREMAALQGQVLELQSEACGSRALLRSCMALQVAEAGARSVEVDVVKGEAARVEAVVERMEVLVGTREDVCGREDDERKGVTIS